MKRSAELPQSPDLSDFLLDYTDDKITLYEAYKPETEGVYDTADDALEYIVVGDRLRDVITQVEVLFRSI